MFSLLCGLEKENKILTNEQKPIQSLRRETGVDQRLWQEEEKNMCRGVSISEKVTH